MARAKYQENFIDLKDACRPRTAQGDEEAWVQCGNWLAQSRKRVFLGQIGVCTVDQVLVSVLPVKHKFVRGFGIGRSMLIVDEVHAYDSYMYGLLEAVLEQQRLGGWQRNIVVRHLAIPTKSTTGEGLELPVSHLQQRLSTHQPLQRWTNQHL